MMTFSLLALALLAGGLGVAQNPDLELPAPNALVRWAIPERIDPRDIELGAASVRVVDLTSGDSDVRVSIDWSDWIPEEIRQDVVRSQRDWFEADGIRVDVAGGVSEPRLVPAGTHEVRVEDSAGNLLASQEVAFGDGAYVTVFVEESDSANGDGFRLHLVTDAPGAMAPAGRASLRVVVVGSAPSVDVWTWRTDRPRAITPPGGPRSMSAPFGTPLDLDRAHLPALTLVVDPDDALIEIRGPGEHHTRHYGLATLVSLVPGTYTLNVSRDGYLSTTRSIELSSDGRSVQEILLDEDPEEDAARLSGPPPPGRIPPIWEMPLGDVALFRRVAPGTTSATTVVPAPGYALEVRRSGTLEVLGRIDGEALRPGASYTLAVAAPASPEEPARIVLLEDSPR